MFGRLFQKRKQKLPRRPRTIFAIGDDTYSQEIVGESFYQSALENIVGGKTDRSAEVYETGFLVCEKNNSYDANAVAILIRNQKVGHLSRHDAREYRKLLSRSFSNLPNCRVAIVIVGGWKRARDEGDFGVKLDMPRPWCFECP